jgi:hypothetical protein
MDTTVVSGVFDSFVYFFVAVVLEVSLFIVFIMSKDGK